MSDILIKASHASKKFCRGLKRSLWYGLKDIGSELAGHDFGGRGRLREGEFWAVQNVSFELSRGQCLGLIGKNGAGKTTVLRMLNGLIRPDVGRIEMRGAVGALIALGAGMKGVLTGRENAYSMAALRGMSKREADFKIGEIIDFSEVGEAIDAPMQSYSTGMKVRLNFAIAAALDPDILLLDEVLAVGDASFRDKCYHRISELRRKCAVIFVSHNMEQISRIATQALVINQGSMHFIGSVDDGIKRYEELNFDCSKNDLAADAFMSVKKPISNLNVKVESLNVRVGNPLTIWLSFDSERSITKFDVKVIFYNSRGAFSADGYVSSGQEGLTIEKGHNQVRIDVDSLPLKNGIYALALNLLDEIGDLIVWSYKNHTIQVSGAYVGGIADCQLTLQLVGS